MKEITILQLIGGIIYILSVIYQIRYSIGEIFASRESKKWFKERWYYTLLIGISAFVPLINTCLCIGIYRDESRN